MISRLLPGAIAAAMFTGVAVAGPFQDGLAAYEQGDYLNAARFYRVAAQQKDAGAQFNLGLMYDVGRGVPRDHAEAARWYRLAATQGVAGAQFHLGTLYLNGKGVPQNDVSAHMWLNLAAAGGVFLQPRFGIRSLPE